MYKLRSLQKNSCSKVQMHFAKCDNFKDNEYKIWAIPFRDFISRAIQNIHTKMSCQDFFIVLYWTSLFMATMGLLMSIVEFYNAFKKKTHFVPTTFSNRTYSHIPLKIRQNGRICGLAITIQSFLFLLYGLTKFNSSYMLLWIVIYGAIMLLETLYWIWNYIHTMIFQLRPLINILILIARWCLILHIKIVVHNNMITENQ